MTEKEKERKLVEEKRFIVRQYYWELTKNPLEVVLKAIEENAFYSKEAKTYAIEYFKKEYSNKKATFMC
jgi:hypothetical protein